MRFIIHNNRLVLVTPPPPHPLFPQPTYPKTWRQIAEELYPCQCPLCLSIDLRFKSVRPHGGPMRGLNYFIEANRW